jgi:hypothetical protein
MQTGGPGEEETWISLTRPPYRRPLEEMTIGLDSFHIRDHAALPGFVLSDMLCLCLPVKRSNDRRRKD